MYSAAKACSLIIAPDGHRFTYLTSQMLHHSFDVHNVW